MPIHGYPGNVITANPTTPSVSSASGVWTTEQQLVNQAAGRWPMAQTQVSRSLRFNSADSTYLNRTPASASNRRTWTWSAWVKRSTLGATQELFDAYWANTDNGYFWVGFTSADAFEVQLYNSTLRTTTQVLRDPSAWYHFVLAVDTTQATAANRVKVYLNGSEITTFSTNNAPTQNLDTAVNYNGAHYIGTFSGTTNLFNGYQTEINLIDGLALDPSYFGFNDSNTGVWTPRQYTGAYGTNGFYVNFSDNSNTTAATLGKDYSGNGNNWTPNNFSVTAGVGNDSMVDSPTSYGTDTGVGGTVRGNYATLNALRPSSAGAAILTNGNLNAAQNTGAYVAATSTIGVSSGKWYWEVTCGVAGFVTSIGITSNLTASGFPTGAATYHYDGGKYVNGSATGYGASYTNGDILGFALDMDAGTLVCYKNGTSQGTLVSSLSGTYYSYVTMYDTNNVTYNFGQRAFTYTAPSGFKALCTQNLPTPTIGATSTTQANQYFDVKLATGSNIGSATLGAFSSVLAWIKDRVNITNHQLLDSVRGTSGSDVLQSNTTSGTVSYSTPTGNSVGWVWKANGTGSSNTAGTITSTVSANTTSGFSIVTYTGTGSNATVGHGLGVAPSMLIIKRRDTTGTWRVGHSSLTSWAYRLNLDETADAAINAGTFNSTAPTSTVFSVGTDTSTNASTGTYVAYCFAPVAGYSAFGSYTGNGSTDGPFVFTNFRPMFILFKQSSASGNDWYIYDAVRSTYNVATNRLFPNSSAAEATNFNTLDILSNGWKVRDSNSAWNASGATYIYAAFAESPFKYALAR